MAKKAKGAAKKKRAVSGKRGRPGRSKQQKSADPRGIIGIAVFCLGLLALVCQFVPSNGGFLNRCMLTVRGLGAFLPAAAGRPVLGGRNARVFRRKEAEYADVDLQYADFSVCGNDVPAVQSFQRQRGSGGG